MPTTVTGLKAGSAAERVASSVTLVRDGDALVVIPDHGEPFRLR